MSTKEDESGGGLWDVRICSQKWLRVCRADEAMTRLAGGKYRNGRGVSSYRKEGVIQPAFLGLGVVVQTRAAQGLQRGICFSGPPQDVHEPPSGTACSRFGLLAEHHTSCAISRKN